MWNAHIRRQAPKGSAAKKKKGTAFTALPATSPSSGTEASPMVSDNTLPTVQGAPVAPVVSATSNFFSLPPYFPNHQLLRKLPESEHQKPIRRSELFSVHIGEETVRAPLEDRKKASYRFSQRIKQIIEKHVHARKPFYHYSSPRLLRDCAEDMETITNTFNTLFHDLKAARQ
ncbi:hypothetical protein R3P38DRAFT_2761573 [Favolaschia claudopus]|uniref:Uncharacterized protein n=1 Tax=Favolaschia claudopus TaxID=2862362 RepID=A0AAW0DS03_9AGAR